MIACLTVARTRYIGYKEVILPAKEDEDNRDDIRLSTEKGATTLLQKREKQYHALLEAEGPIRRGLPDTEQEKIRAEFFDTTPDVAIKALRTIGKGTLYIFTDDDPNTVQKIDLLKEGVSARARARLVERRHVIEPAGADRGRERRRHHLRARRQQRQRRGEAALVLDGAAGPELERDLV